MISKQKHILHFLIILISILVSPLNGYASFSDAGVVGVPSDRPTIVVGDDINYPPYSYLDASGKPTGFNVELAQAVGKAMGYHVDIRLDEWSKVRTALETGKIDAISGLSYSKAREEHYLFTVKHSMTMRDVFTRDGLLVSRVEELANKTVVVQKGDIAAEYLKSLNLNINLVEVATVYDALKFVENNTYDYACLSKLPGQYTIQQREILHLSAQGLNLMPNNYCMAVNKNDENMQVILNSGLQIIKSTGEYDRIYSKWLGVYEEKSLYDYLLQYKWLVIFISLIMGILFTLSLILNHLVNKKTRELQLANVDLIESHQEIEANMEEIIAMESELRVQNDRLRENEAALILSEARNKAILESLPDNVFILNREGIILECIVGNESELYLSKDYFIGKCISEIMPQRIAEDGLRHIQMTLEYSELQRFEYELVIQGNRQIFEMRFVRSKENEVIGITRNVTSDRIYRDRIEYLSYHDQLTGLYNRRFFEEELFRLDTPRNLPLCLIMADVNGLKLINDSFGHRVGDELLVKVAEVMKTACRSDEIISRIGGDEFMILLPHMDSNQAEELIKRIHLLCENEKISSIDLSISFGWEVKHTSDEDIHDVFNRAENYMYKKKLFESPSMRGKTIGAIINTLNEKNKREELHSRRVSEISTIFARVLGFSEREIEEIKTVGLLHDIGKIAIHEEILNKPGKLTQEEYEEIKRHPEIGYRILGSVNDMSDMSNYILYHHEKWDGTGYPRGLHGENIPLQSRMICIADAYDAITSDRSYRKGKSINEAIEEFKRCSGTHFDPNLVTPFIEKVLPLLSQTDH